MPPATATRSEQAVYELLDAVFGQRPTIDAQEFADAIGIHRNTIKNHHLSGRLDLVLVGDRKLVITKAAARRWLTRHRQGES